MRITTTDVYLDTLCLLIYTSDDISRKLAEDVLQVFQEDIKENPIVDNPETRYWLDIIQDIVEMKIDTSKQSDMAGLLRKYKEAPIAKANPDLYLTLEEVYNGRNDIGSTRLDGMKRNISNWLIFYRTDKYCKKASKQISRYPNIVNPERQQQVLDEVYEYAKLMVKAHEEAIAPDLDQLDFVDFTDKSALRKVNEINKKRKTTGVMRFGLRRLNRMIDAEINGVKPGEFGCIVSPSHHGKTLTLMNMARWIACYNTPNVAPGFRAAIVFISLENELDENVNIWFKDAYVNIFHKQPTGLSEEEIVDLIAAEYGKNGYSLLLFRRLANQFGFDEYVALIKKLQQSRYQIVASFIDYITLMRTNEITGGSTRAQQLQQLVRDIKTFSNHEHIFTMTAMQIDRDGVKQMSSNTTYLVKRFTQGNLADCSYAFHEFDLSFFQAIERIEGGGTFLTIKIAKHRYAVMDPDCQFGAWRFTSLGLMDDINSDDSSVTDIYDASMSAEETSVFDNENAKDIMQALPTPPTREGKKETADDIVISKSGDPNKSIFPKPIMGSEVPVPPVANQIPAEPLLKLDVPIQK